MTREAQDGAAVAEADDVPFPFIVRLAHLGRRLDPIGERQSFGDIDLLVRSSPDRVGDVTDGVVIRPVVRMPQLLVKDPQRRKVRAIGRVVGKSDRRDPDSSASCVTHCRSKVRSGKARAQAYGEWSHARLIACRFLGDVIRLFICGRGSLGQASDRQVGRCELICGQVRVG